MRAVVLLVCIIGTPVAFADDHTGSAPAPTVAAAEPPGMTPVDEPPHRDVVAVAPTPTGPTQLEQLARYDAAYDRAYAHGTAVTLRPGDFDISLRSVLKHGAMLSVAAGVTRNIELSAEGLKSSYLGEAVGAGIKIAVVRAPKWALAIDASVFAFFAHPEFSAGGNIERMYSTAARVTTCATSACDALFSAGLGVAVASDPFGTGPSIVPTLDSSIIFGKSWARPMFEIAYLGGWLGFGGFRFGGRHVGFDAGLGVISDNGPGGSATTAVIGLSVRP